MDRLSLFDNLEAHRSGAITWDQYIDNLLARCTEKQKKDARQGPRMRWRDPFGHMVWSWSARICPIEDVRNLKAVFNAYRHGTSDDLKSSLNMLEESRIPAPGVRGLKKSLSLLACQERRADVLEFCLKQGGFHIESTLVDTAESIDESEDPETYRVVWASSDLQRLLKARINSVDEEGWSTHTEAVFDTGGRLPVKW